MKKTLIALSVFGALVAGLVTAVPAQAGGWHSNHRPYHRPHHGHSYGYRYNSGHYYGGYRRHGRDFGDHYKYLGAGIFLGAVANAVLRPTPVYRTRVVHRQPPARIVHEPYPTQRSAAAVSGQPVPPEGHDVFLRRKANGECWLVETEANGDQIMTPQDPEVCD